MKVVFSNRAYTAILAETLSKIATETGGVFLGKYIDDVWYIVESIDLGINSVFEVDYFRYDQQYIQHLVNKKILLYKSKLELVGLWHRHPGSFDIFSNTDAGTNSQYAAMRPEGAVSVLVNLEPEFRLTIYHVKQPCVYEKILNYKVGDQLFPQGLLDYKNPISLKNQLNGNIIENLNHCIIRLNKKNLDKIMEMILPELQDKYLYIPKRNLFHRIPRNNYASKIALSIASDMLFLGETYGIGFDSIPSRNKIIIQDQYRENIKLIFTYNAKESVVLMTYLNSTFYYREGLFEYLIGRE